MSKQFWNDRYAQEDYVYGVAPNQFLKSSLDLFPPKSKILCLAEGEGRNSAFLASHGHNITAIDFSASGKIKAEKLAKENHVALDYIVTDINDFDFGTNKWDAIISIFAHTDPATRQRTFKQSLQSLKPNGIFLLEAYHPNQLEMQYGTGGPKQIDWLILLNELDMAFAGQDTILRKEYEREVNEGTFHSGKAFVTQFICRKKNS